MALEVRRATRGPRPGTASVTGEAWKNVQSAARACSICAMAIPGLLELTQRIDGLTERVAQVVGDPTADPAAAEALLEELQRTERERRRLLKRSVERASREVPRDAAREDGDGAAQSAPRAARSLGMPVRERVLAGLELLGVPSRGGLIAVAAAARTGEPVEPRQLASLRRSELASWRSGPDRRPSYVVPALHVRRFEPLRGTLASSAWEPWRRIVGPLSPRADHLRATIRVAEHVVWARERSEEVADRFERMLWRLARSVAGVLEAPEFDVDRALEAAHAELAMVDEEDRGEREESARRLDALSSEQRLFGAGMKVISGEAAS